MSTFPASEMTYTVSSGALNSTPTNHVHFSWRGIFGDHTRACQDLHTVDLHNLIHQSRLLLFFMSALLFATEPVSVCVCMR